MGLKVTPTVRAAEGAAALFRLLEYEYDPSAEAVGLQAAQALGIEALAAAVSAKRAERAPPAKAERVTGYLVGGISPIGQRRRLRTFLDHTALIRAELLVSGGRRGLKI